MVQKQHSTPILINIDVEQINTRQAQDKSSQPDFNEETFINLIPVLLNSLLI